jgi:hypothetical protein
VTVGTGEEMAGFRKAFKEVMDMPVQAAYYSVQVPTPFLS